MLVARQDTMGTEIDTLVRSSLASLLEEIRKPSWRGRRERELVSLFCFGHLAAHCRAHGFLHDLGQIGIEVAVPQIPGQRALTGADSSKHQVCKDIVVWPGRAMTCWGIDGRPSVRPAC